MAVRNKTNRKRNLKNALLLVSILIFFVTLSCSESASDVEQPKSMKEALQSIEEIVTNMKRYIENSETRIGILINRIERLEARIDLLENVK
jgi:vacuolar-type H+-ATPase subunit D/Vma8